MSKREQTTWFTIIRNLLHLAQAGSTSCYQDAHSPTLSWPASLTGLDPGRTEIRSLVLGSKSR